MNKNINIHNKTEKEKKRVIQPPIGKLITPATSAPQNPTSAPQNPTSAPQKPSSAPQNQTSANKKKPRKKTTRSGNAFIRPPRQNLLIIKYSEPIVLRFD